MLRFEFHRQHVETLIQAVLTAVHPGTAVRRHLQREGNRLTIGPRTASPLNYELGEGCVYLIAVGKAALTMGLATAEILHDALTAGILIGKRQGEQKAATLMGVHSGAAGHSDDAVAEKLPSTCRLYYAGHPISNQNSLEAAAAVRETLKSTTAADLVLCLISGGASALLAQPVVPLAAWQQLTDTLLAGGCTIQEFNRVRRHLDQVKGGGLARWAAPAVCASLILSDVVGNPLGLIGSGPTVPNEDDPAHVLAILNRYDVAGQLPVDKWRLIHDALTQPDKDERPLPRQLFNMIIGDVRLAAETAVAAATELGFSAQLLTTYLEGEAREVGRVAAALAKEAAGRRHQARCLVLAGETTVTLRGSGVGGRNQEVALAAAVALDGWDNVALATFATDGDDGPSGAAGAIVTGATAMAARARGLDPHDYLARNDSFTFFQQAGALLETGPTGSNVNDLIFIFTYP